MSNDASNEAAEIIVTSVNKAVKEAFKHLDGRVLAIGETVPVHAPGPRASGELRGYGMLLTDSQGKLYINMNDPYGGD